MATYHAEMSTEVQDVREKENRFTLLERAKRANYIERQTDYTGMLTFHNLTTYEGDILKRALIPQRYPVNPNANDQAVHFKDRDHFMDALGQIMTGSLITPIYLTKTQIIKVQGERGEVPEQTFEPKITSFCRNLFMVVDNAIRTFEEQGYSDFTQDPISQQAFNRANTAHIMAKEATTTVWSSVMAFDTIAEATGYLLNA